MSLSQDVAKISHSMLQTVSLGLSSHLPQLNCVKLFQYSAVQNLQVAVEQNRQSFNSVYSAEVISHSHNSVMTLV